jgi:phospholipase C
MRQRAVIACFAERSTRRACAEGDAAPRSPIEHVVLLIQEGRTFNALFSMAKTGKMRVRHGTPVRTEAH